MSAVMACARAALRRRWRATIVLSLVVGLAAGVVMASVAGARRTASAMDRFLAYNHPADVHLEGDEAVLAQAEHLPQVEMAGQGAYVLLVPPGPDGTPDAGAIGSVNPFLRFRADLSPPLVVEGRLPDPAQATEVAVDEEMARRFHLDPGSPFTMFALSPEQLGDDTAGLEVTGVVPAGPEITFTVTGVERQPFDISPASPDTSVSYLGTADLELTPAFWQAYGVQVATLGGPDGAREVRLRRDAADVNAFVDAVRGLPGGDAVSIGEGSDAATAAAGAQRAIDVQAAGLYAFAALAAAAGLLVVGQSLARQAQLDAGDAPVLRAMGLTGRQLVAAAMVRAALVGGTGAALAVGLAVALSPLAPVGLARQAEIDPGLAVDTRVLAAGVVVTAAAVVIRMGLAAWSVSRRAAHADAGGQGLTSGRRPSAVARWLSGTGAPPSAVAGVRMALEPGAGPGTVPVRSTLAGALVAVGAVAAALCFGASLDRLIRVHSLQGWTWNATVGNPNNPTPEDEDRARLAASPVVGGYSALALSLEDLQVDGVPVRAGGIDFVKGDVGPPMVEGRPPRGGDEVALGSVTLRRLRRRVGDTVEISAGGEVATLRVVGRGVLYPSSIGLGEGALLSLDGLRRFAPDAAPEQYLVRYAPGVDPAEGYAQLRHDWGPTVARFLPPVQVENLRRVRGLPPLLAGLVALLGLASLGHTLIATSRRRRRDLAVLKTLGFLRRQVRGCVAWQASALAVAAIVVGVPLGVAAGRWAWALVAEGIGTPAAPVTPLLGILAASAATMVAANVLAALPAWAASRLHPASALRAE